MYKLKSKKGKVNFLLRTGKDFVRSSMTVPAAKLLIDNGKMVKSENPRYPICIDDRWFFEGKLIEPKSEEE